MTPVNTAIISYGGTSIPILGKVHLCVWRRHFRYLLDCNLVDSKKVRPILGRKVRLGMNIIQYLDNNQLNRPQESDGEVYIHDVPASSPISADQLIKSFPRVFADCMGGRSCWQLSSRVRSLMRTFMTVIVFECRQITSPSSPFSGKNFVQPPSVFRGCCSGYKSTVWMSFT